ncbi:geranylgeranyl transferase type-2 subunit alpha [Tremella mesenterica]|uniref:Geranylgeranyl transferase type-2 subunit alpha n=1 Tax=Tremella mesenterica TaxID=5217 RepID=A0A4Q1BES3_TREME|nr:uncharacterized protein TREMEDRAFT_64100 [Tremella mesenterica DSM 1558]EIW67518.1 hypothetical protein TREMEDRAFT_64100 [Tremella mesenterica DSM 1558]RXK35795.1 geranylgeranyl transferase type-2 subunit alpha [Tremella mesenterica]
MHGIKRSRLSSQAEVIRREKEAGKIAVYGSLQAEILTLKKNKIYTPDALKKTTELLDLNPEFYTIWNYRRHILLHLFNSANPEEIVSLLTTDLRLTMSYLQVHPKVYWIWNHRKWCLENVPVGPEDTERWRNEFWAMELAVIEKMLDADARNFHAWDYRRYVLSSLPESFKPPRTALDELRYTKKKIESNFSNFSAWHLRTKILGGMWEGMEGHVVEKQKDAVALDDDLADIDEFELVRQALWTDPGDQSGWLYHRWLIGDHPEESRLREEINSIRELNETEPDSRWCMNALAQYDILLSSSTRGEERNELRQEARGLLRRLGKVDVFRKQRYRDIAKNI